MTLSANIKKSSLSAGLGDGFVTITDNLNPSSPIKKSPGESYTCEAAPVVGAGYNYLYNTGQQNSYRAGDNVSLLNTYWSTFTASQLGGIINPIDTSDFTKVLNNNAFGNKERYTDINGLQTYADDYVIDHHTGFGIYRVLQSSATWNNAVDNSLGPDFGGSNTQNGFNDWFLPNDDQLNSILNSGESSGRINYPPFNISVSFIWTSSTAKNITINGVRFNCTSVDRTSVAKTTSHPYLFFRKHF